MNTEKYKDRSYEETIFLIKGIIEDLDITINEYLWEHTKGYFTTMVIDKSLNVFAIGKGCSKQQSFASAYGEFMERLQNMAFFKFKNVMSESISEKYETYYAPDEKLVGAFDNLQFNNEVDQVLDYVMDGKKEELSELWLGLHKEFEKKNQRFLALPFINMITNEKIYFPAKLLIDAYGTNGMCAGNSSEEAIVQGISEILERYANKVIYEKKLTPPIIPEEVINKMPEIKNMLIELNKDYKIEIRDCSLGLEFPVVGLWLYDKNYGKYYIKFGSHPILKVAIERCITELFQGRGNDDKLKWLRDLSFENISEDKKNLYNAYRTGKAYYPYEVLGDNYSYLYSDVFIKSDTTNNEEFLKFLLKVINNNNNKILCRDVSFLGINAYQIIIVGLSELFDFNKNILLRNNKYEHIKRISRNIAEATDAELHDLLWSMKNYLSYNDKMANIADIDLKGNCIYNTSCKIVEFFIYLKFEKIEDAYRAISEYIEKGKINLERLLLFKCFKDYLAAKIKFISESEIYALLNKLYASDLIDYVKKMIDSPNLFLTRFPKIDCIDCNSCQLNKYCRTKNTIEIQGKLIDRHKKYIQSAR